MLQETNRMIFYYLIPGDPDQPPTVNATVLDRLPRHDIGIEVTPWSGEIRFDCDPAMMIYQRPSETESDESDESGRPKSIRVSGHIWHSGGEVSDRLRWCKSACGSFYVGYDGGARGANGSLPKPTADSSGNLVVLNDAGTITGVVNSNHVTSGDPIAGDDRDDFHRTHTLNGSLRRQDIDTVGDTVLMGDGREWFVPIVLGCPSRNPARQTGLPLHTRRGPGGDIEHFVAERYQALIQRANVFLDTLAEELADEDPDLAKLVGASQPRLDAGMTPERFLKACLFVADVLGVCYHVGSEELGLAGVLTPDAVQNAAFVALDMAERLQGTTAGETDEQPLEADMLAETVKT